MSTKRRPQRNAGGSSNRPGRPRAAFDVTGIYANPRFTHLATSLVLLSTGILRKNKLVTCSPTIRDGCVVQLQVKNGGIYDGVLKTFSPKMDVVLEMAHKHKDSSNNNQNAFSSIPSKEYLIEKLILNASDILSITALGVDMDYAVRDSFTDSAISKCNTNHTEMDMKQLQPWVGGEVDGEEIGGLERDSSNGWDADDMFKTNAERFNVQSCYDESLTQYTTPLEKKDTKEFKSREEEAMRIAKEIESTDQYVKSIALENGDGDEEEKFSAVKRTPENNTHISNMQSSGGGAGKYIPPARRPQTAGRNISQKSYNTSNHMPNSRPGNQHIPPRLQNQYNSHQSQHPPIHPHPQPHPQQVRSQTIKEPKVNGNADKEERERRIDVEPSLKTSPGQDSVPVVTTENKNETAHSPPGGHKVREKAIKELLEFKTNFKLGTEENKTEEVRESEEVKSSKETAEPVETKQIEETQPVEKESSNTESQQKDDLAETVKNSTLNPKAKEFVLNPNAKIFQPKQQPQPVPTPPRPHTQSPITPNILQPMPPAMSGGPYIPFIQQNMVLPQQPQQASQPQYKAPKRAVVSLNQPRPDLTAAQAATGQPLFNQTSVQSQQYGVLPVYPVQQVQQVVQQGYQMGQIMPMPAATGHRMATPNSMVPTSLGAQSNQSHGSVYMPGPQAQPVPAHMQFPQALPAHMPIPGGGGQPQQGGQMNPQSSGHPAPSPVQQHTGAPNSQTHQQVRPPTSGTPQPQGGPYSHMAPANMQGHPPLIPSPQNQSSQQTMHPTMQYQITSQGHQLYNQTPFSQTHPPTSSVTQSMHGPSSHNTHQIVVMPNPHPGQVQPGHPPQHNQQYPHHMSGAGQQHMMQPTGVPTGLHGSNPSNMVHHFVSHQVQGPPVQPYQQHTQNH